MDNAVPNQEKVIFVKQEVIENVNVTLTNQNFFAQHTPINEVEVTRVGKPFLPSPQYQIRGLESDGMYFLCINMKSVDIFKYKREGVHWRTHKVNLKALPKDSRKVAHHDGVQSGRYWMSKVVVFKELRLTQNAKDEKCQNTVVKNYHKYRPQLTIFKVVGHRVVSEIGSFTFENTDFIPLATIKNPWIRVLHTVRQHNRPDHA